MLRAGVFGGGLALLALAVLLWCSGYRNGGLIPLVAWGVILAGGIYFERYHYKPELDRPPGPGWVRTAERSRGANGVVAVWFNPASGERAYVREPGEGQGSAP
jgi:hypothetical protein